MIELASPWALVLLLPVLLLPLQPWLSGVNRTLVPALSFTERRWTLRLLLAWLPRALQVVGLVCLVLALARPRITNRETVVESQGLDILLAIDVSGSMEAEDFVLAGQPTNRLEAAKAVVGEFISHRPNDRIGLVVFGEEAFTQVPLTLDHDALVEAVRQVQIGVAGQRATAIGSAIAVSARRLKELEAPSRILILLTDGQSNAGRLTPIQAAQAANALGVRIYTIGVGGGRQRTMLGLLRGFSSDLDENTLRRVADATGGQYFRAKDTLMLQQVYATIDELEPSTAEVKDFTEYEELFRYPLIPGLVLLMLQALLGATWLRRGP